MAGETIDGTGISSMTIDGTSVREVTVDGKLAWSNEDLFSTIDTTYTYQATGNLQCIFVYEGFNQHIAVDSGTVYQYDDPEGSPSQTHDISSYTSHVDDIYWDTNVYEWVLLYDGVVHEYSYWSPGTTWDLTSEDSTPLSMFRRNSNWYITGASTENVYEYDLSYNYTGTSHDISQTSQPNGLMYVNGYWYVLCTSQNEVFRYNPDWSYTGYSYSVSSNYVDLASNYGDPFFANGGNNTADSYVI